MIQVPFFEREVYVWTWLPKQRDPVLAGVLSPSRGGEDATFSYAASYLSRPDSISLYAPELPLGRGRQAPPDSMRIASCLRDASPDAWGRRVLLHRLLGRHGTDVDVDVMAESTCMLRSGSNRFGAIDFQASPDRYVARNDTAPMEDLIRAVDDIESDSDLPEAVAEALVDGTTIGGARPKVQVTDRDGVGHIAKFSASTDRYPVIRGEAMSLSLARRAGIETTASRVERIGGRDVLFVQRFDRPRPGERIHAVSGLTILGLDEMYARYATYPDVVDGLAGLSANAASVGPEVFRRIAFNIAIGNIDDHARNHAAFWDGQSLRLTPAYDLCPQPRSGGTAAQAMAYGRNGERESSMSGLARVSSEYGLSDAEGRGIIDEVVSAVEDGLQDAADEARLSSRELALFKGRQLLNPAVLYGWTGSKPREPRGTPSDG